MEPLAWLGVIAVLFVAYMFSIFIRLALKERRERKEQERKEKAAEEAAFLKRLTPVLALIRQLPVGQVTYTPAPRFMFVGIWMWVPQPEETFTPSVFIIEKAAYHYLRAVEAGQITPRDFTSQSALVSFVHNKVQGLLW